MPESPIKPPPTGRDTLRWLGPAFLWMLSAAGSGELLLTPRIASMTGYVLLWAMLGAVALKWFINREIGRWTVCTGRTILDGFGMAGRWAVLAIALPQLAVAVATVAGLSAAASTAVSLLLLGPAWAWASALVLAGGALVSLGGYGQIEWAASRLAVGITAAVLVTALTTGPSPAGLAAGLVPSWPGGAGTGEVLPWLGFMLAGAAGLMWYSYWVANRGYGAAGADRVPDDGETLRRLRGWVRLSDIATTLAVLGSLLIALAFLVLGAELLGPERLVPQESETAGVLAGMLGKVWGRPGYWFMAAAVLVTFCGTLFSVQDGFGRMFADAADVLGWGDGAAWKPWIIGVVLVAAPVAVVLLTGEPVSLLQFAGAIEAAHIPLVAGLVLWLNRRLPEELRPGIVALVGTGTAAAFFLGFAAIYLAGLLGSGG